VSRRSSASRLPAALAEPIDNGINALRSPAVDASLTAIREQAREQLPRLETAYETAREIAEERLADAAVRSRPARREARKRAEAAVLALKGDLPVRRRRWPKAFLLLGAGALAGAVAGLVVQRRPAAQGSAETYPPVGTVPRPGPVSPDSVTLPSEAARVTES
jgi:hypothetical protein